MFRNVPFVSPSSVRSTRAIHRWIPRLLIAATLLAPLAAAAQPKPASSAATTASTSAPAAATAVPAATTGAPAPTAAPAATTAAPATSAAPASTGTPGTMDGATYAVRLRDLEQRINELKE